MRGAVTVGLALAGPLLAMAPLVGAVARPASSTAWLATTDGGLVEGHDAAAYARELQRAEPAVAAAWGGGPFWTLLLVPSSSTAAARLSGQQDQDDVAAVETGGTVVVEPAAWAQLSPVGRQVTLRHELTHVVSGPATTARTPTWLIEGLADAVGFAGSGLSTAQASAELTTRVRAGFRPAALPADAAYAPGSADLAATYEEGWLACRLIEARVGVAGLVAAYRETGVRGWPAAVRDVLHTTPAAFTAAWRARVAALA